MWSATGRTRRWAMGIALRLSLVAVLAIALLRAGAAYFVCAQMDFVSESPCCAHCEAGGDESPAIDRAPCCARETVRALPSSTASQATVAVGESPLVAILAPTTFDVVPPAPFFERAHTSTRAGPPPRDTRASRLMVFLL